MVTDLDLPREFQNLRQAQTEIMLSEMSRSLAFEREYYIKKMSPLLIKHLTDGTSISYLEYEQALKIAQSARESIADLFDHQVDLIIAPSATGEAPLLKEGTGDPIFCRIWTVLGLPCINLNVATGSNGLPVGVQLIAGPGKDRFLLSAARAFALALPDPVLRDQA
jgi:Asp-tRNA(Asn)/Glu-tRNA(Gln) amidotransferase A subunit family amidase